jgi:hypothetical protein
LFHKEDSGIVGGKNENQLAHQFLPGGAVFRSKSAIHSLRSLAFFAQLFGDKHRHVMFVEIGNR